MDYKTFRYVMSKRAASVMTPEAQQAAMQPPMDPSMGGGGMPPADPAMMGGMPPAGGDPAAMGGMPLQASGPNGGQIPPELLQDQGFLQFLSDMMGIIFDPQSGMFMSPDGQAIPADIIIQAYQEYQAQMQQEAAAPPMGQPPMDPSMGGGGMPPADPAMTGGQPPMDPAMAGGQPPMDPAAMGGIPPMDPAIMGGMPPADPATMGGQPPMDPGMGAEQPSIPPEGMEEPPAVPDQVMDQIVSAVMSGVETMMQQYTDKIEAKFAELNDKLDAIGDVAAGTHDNTSNNDRDQISKLRQEMEADLTPVKQASVNQPSKKSKNLVNIFDIIQG